MFDLGFGAVDFLYNFGHVFPPFVVAPPKCKGGGYYCQSGSHWAIEYLFGFAQILQRVLIQIILIFASKFFDEYRYRHINHCSQKSSYARRFEYAFAYR
jgi:hypothetical protein